MQNLTRCKGHTHKGHREKVLKVVTFRIFSGLCQGIFRVFFPMPFLGVPFWTVPKELVSN